MDFKLYQMQSCKYLIQMPLNGIDFCRILMLMVLPSAQNCRLDMTGLQFLFEYIGKR